MRSADLTAAARIRDAAIEHFGPKEGLRKACDDFVVEEIRSSKSETIQSTDPATWFAALAEIESFAPLVSYLVRSMQSGGELAKMLWQSMIDNAYEYMEEGVQAGTVRPSRDPYARARFLTLAGGGALLLYLQMHETPTDLKAVLRDYSRDMVLPSLEVYTEGVMADRTMFDAFLAAENQER